MSEKYETLISSDLSNYEQILPSLITNNYNDENIIEIKNLGINQIISVWYINNVKDRKLFKI